MTPEVDAGGLYDIEVAGGLDRAAAEAVQLEIRRLARRFGVEITALRIEQAPDET